MKLYEVIEDKHRYMLPDKYFESSSKYGSPKVGYIGELVEEFNNPIGLRLAIFKVFGFDDYYSCMPLTSFKILKKENFRPFISWIYLPSEVSISSVTIKGNIIGFQNKTIQLQSAGCNIEYQNGDEINMEIDTSNGVNRESILLKEEGLQVRKYSIEIRNSKKLNKEIKRQLVESEIFTFCNRKDLKKLLNNSIKQNYFSPSDKIDSILNINGNGIVKGEFSFFLLKAKKYLNSNGCQLEIGEEFQKFHADIKSRDGEEMFTHQISVNNNIFEIFEGYLSSERTYEIYIESLMNIIDSILQQYLKDERTGIFTGIDGVYLAILTTDSYTKLEEICANLENEFIKRKSD